MGYPKGIGPRRCPVCLLWFDVQRDAMVKIGNRYFCKRDAPYMQRGLRRGLKTLRHSNRIRRGQS